MRVADEVGVRLVTSLTFSPTNHNSTHYVRTPCVILSVCTLLGEPKVQFDNVCEANLGRSVAECRIFVACGNNQLRWKISVLQEISQYKQLMIAPSSQRFYTPLRSVCTVY